MNQKNIERVAIFSVNDILKYYDLSKRSFMRIDGKLSRIKCRKLDVFRKSSECVNCKLKGEFFALEREKVVNHPTYHLKLYARKNNVDILMTQDHCIPKSKGGKNNIDNYNTLCYICNQAKKNNLNFNK